jgi:hypothetical protein
VGPTWPGGLLNRAIGPDLEPDLYIPTIINYYSQIHLNIIFISLFCLPDVCLPKLYSVRRSLIDCVVLTIIILGNRTDVQQAG